MTGLDLVELMNSFLKKFMYSQNSQMNSPSNIKPKWKLGHKEKKNLKNNGTYKGLPLDEFCMEDI